MISEGMWEDSFPFLSARMPEHNSDVRFRQTSLLICSFAMRSNIPNRLVWRSGMILRSFVRVSMWHELNVSCRYACNLCGSVR